MLVRCIDCGQNYDDGRRWTTCPHSSLSVCWDTPYCWRHDLYDCHICRSAKTVTATEKREEFSR